MSRASRSGHRPWSVDLRWPVLVVAGLLLVVLLAVAILPPMTILQPEHVEFLSGTRRLVLATITARGAPRLVPICFAVLASPLGPLLFSALDEKPKRGTDRHALARVQDLIVRPRVSLLADRWDEDWARLAWLRVDATATLVEPGHPEHGPAVLALRARYEPYRTQRLEANPIIRLEPTRTVWWSGADGAQPGG